MAGAFAGGHRTVVASIARCCRLCVINGHRKRPPSGAGGMAAVTVVGALRVSAALTDGYGAVMAEATLLISFGMGKRRGHRQPDGGGMASVAQITGQWVIAGFEGAWTDTVVTAGASAGLPRHGRVIKRSRDPSGNQMTHIALCGGSNVIETLA